MAEIQKKVTDLLAPYKPEQIVTESWSPELFTDEELGFQPGEQSTLK